MNAFLAEQAAALERRQGRRTKPLVISPPVSGHYGKSDAASIPSQFALKTTNLFSDGQEVSVRPGYGATVGFPSTWCLQAWDYEFGGERLAMFRTATGLANDDGSVAQAANFSGDIMVDEISNRLVTAGGGVSPFLWDGSAFSEMTLSMPDGSATSTAQLSGVVSHHDRLYFWREDDPDGCQIYYLPGVGAITGTLKSFPLYALGNIKGQVKTALSLTIDAGHGANDVLAILTTTGQIVVYEGLDPDDETDWRLWGRVPGTSELVSPNAIVRVATDAYALTSGAVLSLRSLLSQGSEALVSPPSEALGGELAADIAAGAGLDGWQMITDPKGRFVLLNVPAGGSYAQWVYSYDGKGWWRWTLPARWWFQRAGELYFIDSAGAVQLFGAIGDAGAAITTTWVTPWLPISQSQNGAPVHSVLFDLLVKTAPTLTVTCLVDRQESADDIVEGTQTETLELQRAAGDFFQNVENDVLLLNQSGRFVQMRVTVAATEAKWLGMTLNP